MLRKKKDDLMLQLQQLNESDPDESNMAEILNVKFAWNLEADKEELYWEQRARTNWIRMGDCNTLFFHKAATQRRKRNMVRGLEDENGDWVEDEPRLKDISLNFVMDLFSAQPTRNCERLLTAIQPCILE